MPRGIKKEYEYRIFSTSYVRKDKAPFVSRVAVIYDKQIARAVYCFIKGISDKEITLLEIIGSKSKRIGVRSSTSINTKDVKARLNVHKPRRKRLPNKKR